MVRERSIPALPIALALSVAVNMGGIATLASLGDAVPIRGHAAESALVIELPPAAAPPEAKRGDEPTPPEAPPKAPEPPPSAREEKPPEVEPPTPRDREARLGQADSQDPNSPAWLGSSRATDANQAPRSQVDQAAQAKQVGASPSGEPESASANENPVAGEGAMAPEASERAAEAPSPNTGEVDQKGEGEARASMLDLGAEARRFAEPAFEPPPKPEAQPEQSLTPTPPNLEGEGLKALLDALRKAGAKEAGAENRVGGAGTTRPSAAPKSASAPGGGARAPGNPALEGEKGELANRESDASSTSALTVDLARTGKVVAGKGLRINTVKPHYNASTRLLAFPENPVVRVTFGRDGKVIRMSFERGTGEPAVDDPLRDAIHRWTAEGEELGTIPPNQNQVGLAVSFKILMR